MLQIGTLLQGRFSIEQQLAQGGMGAVYLATDQKFGSRVAIKERSYEHAELAEAFEREARILNSLHHPVLPHVSDYFSGPDGHFLVMEYIEGEDLSEMLKRNGAFPVEDVIGWAMELLDTLDYLHSQDPPIIHRDIKPGNLKLTSRGNIVLLDFGLAKETSGNTQGARSIFGYSRRYSPLEQIEGAGTDVRSDIFSLGATLYHLMTGEAPVDVLARASAIVAGRPDPLVPADHIDPDVPVPVAKVLSQALALDSEKRFASASAMRFALEAARDGKADLLFVETSEPEAIGAAPHQMNADGNFETIDDTYDIEDTEADAVTALPPRPRRSKAGSTIWPVNVPVVQRPGLWLAVLVLALVAIGVAGIKLSGSRSNKGPADGQPVGKLTVGTSPEQPQTEPDTSAQSAEPEAVADTAEDTQPQPEVALDNKNIEKPEKRSVSKTDGETNVNDKTERRTQRQPRVRVMADDTAFGQPAVQRLPERPRFVRRQEPDYGPPASSIEMIFTGIPPERRRRWRRIYQ